ncbi:MAG: acyl-CoA reductase [Vicingaceae bacterium]
MITGIIPKIIFNSTSELPVLKTNNYFIDVADDLVLNFLSDLSKSIIRDSFFKAEPSFISLGFWLRKSNMNRILSENTNTKDINSFVVKPIGKVFHLCPSNVDTMFIYSLVLALLAGNKNVVRISSKLESDLIFRLFDLFNSLLEKKEYKSLIDYINVVSYERSDKLNEEISLNVNGRIIWGGDETVNQFKKYATKPKVKDLYFTDKVSLSIINLEDISKFNDSLDDVVTNLYNDIYTFNQKGCSSPHSLFIVGSTIDRKEVLERIYIKLSEMAEAKYEEDISSIASLKLNQSVVDIIEGKIFKTINSSNYITFSELSSNEIPHSCGAGYLYYQLLDTLEDIIPFINAKTQTITYSGLNNLEIKEFLNKIDVETVDRIVPIGKALDFDYIWDGYNIFTEMLSFKSVK